MVKYMCQSKADNIVTTDVKEIFHEAVANYVTLVRDRYHASDEENRQDLIERFHLDAAQADKFLASDTIAAVSAQ